ncbi:MAG TPA: phosphatidate cytidylyltransferase [Burkholderiaceae bacterium]|jgi:phosphatidate cytidylyltransferase|nr:phosphatidate cytidylyltransferase [Burkholderiaceae bacterium]
MLRTRLITAVVLLALIGLAAAWGSWALLGLFALLVAAALYEWMRLAGCSLAVSTGTAVVYGALLIATSALDVRAPDRVNAAASLAACALWCALGVGVAYADRGRFRIGRGASMVLAVALLTAGWMALDSLLARGLQWLVSVLAVVWIADIAAYFSGRALGRHKLAPRVSPGKTWEGVYGAVVLVSAAALAAHAGWPRAGLWSNRLLSELAWPLALAALWGVVALSIVGDLFESLLKRQAQVKDSGRLLPGHGGVLDRIDATLPALPAAVLIDWWTR